MVGTGRILAMALSALVLSFWAVGSASAVTYYQYLLQSTQPCGPGDCGLNNYPASLTTSGYVFTTSLGPQTTADLIGLHMGWDASSGQQIDAQLNSKLTVGGAPTITASTSGLMLTLNSPSDYLYISGSDPNGNSGSWTIGNNGVSPVHTITMADPAFGLWVASTPITLPYTVQLGTYYASPGPGGGEPPIVPIPAALPLLASGLAALGLLGWRRRQVAGRRHGSAAA